MNEMTYFNRLILNNLMIAVRVNKGELHGFAWGIADKIQTEMGGPSEEDVVNKMKFHLLAVGFDYLTEGSPLAYFRSMDGQHHFVDRGLLNVE